MLMAQIVGFVGIVMLIAIFQVNDRKKILQLQIISCLVWTLYYVLMGAYTGAALIFLGAVRCYLFANYREKEWILQLTIAAMAIATLITWESWYSLFALLGMILATTALWQKNPQAIRTISLFVTPFWLTYNYLSGSYFGIVGDLVTFASLAIGVWRFDVIPYLQRRKQQAAEVSDASLV